MSEAVRLYQYRSLLSAKRAVSAAELMDKLEISPAPFKRDIAKLRDQLHVPIRFDRDLSGYLLDKDCADLHVLDTSAKEVTARTIDEALGAGHGIFGGTPKAWAKLRFTRVRACKSRIEGGGANIQKGAS